METRRSTREVNPGRFVAVLQPNATSPAFILTVDVATRTASVRRVAGGPPPGKSYELWLVSDRFPAPRSLGLVGATSSPGRAASYDPAVISGRDLCGLARARGWLARRPANRVLFGSHEVGVVTALALSPKVAFFAVVAHGRMAGP